MCWNSYNHSRLVADYEWYLELINPPVEVGSDDEDFYEDICVVDPPNIEISRNVVQQLFDNDDELSKLGLKHRRLRKTFWRQIRKLLSNKGCFAHVVFSVGKYFDLRWVDKRRAETFKMVSTTSNTNFENSRFDRSKYFKFWFEIDIIVPSYKIEFNYFTIQCMLRRNVRIVGCYKSVCF